MIEAFLLSQQAPFIEIAFEYFDLVEEVVDHPTQVNLYIRLLKACIIGYDITDSDGPHIPQRPLSDLIGRIKKHVILPQEVKLNLLIRLYKTPQVIAVDKLEEKLFDAFLQILETLKKVSQKFSKPLKKFISAIAPQIPNRRSQQPFKALRFLKEVIRLELTDKVTITALWNQTCLLAPTDVGLTLLYQHLCLTIGQTLDSARHLNTIDREQLRILVKELLQQKFKYAASNHIPIEEVGGILYLLEELTHLGCEWKERHLLHNALMAISNVEVSSDNDNEIRRIIDKFYRDHIHNYAEELVRFLMDGIIQLQNPKETRIINFTIY